MATMNRRLKAWSEPEKEDVEMFYALAIADVATAVRRIQVTHRELGFSAILLDVLDELDVAPYELEDRIQRDEAEALTELAGNTVQTA